jgi:hypothetical protein
MGKIGQGVEETIDSMDRKAFESAFVSACEILNQTAEALYEKDSISEPAFQKFIRENWAMISSIAIPQQQKLPQDLPFEVRRAVPAYSLSNTPQELVIYVVRQALTMRRLPLALGFHNLSVISVDGEKLLLSKNLVFALLASVIFNPINKNEKVQDKYWLNVWGFKMFISELWGREDLVKRIMDLYF